MYIILYVFTPSFTFHIYTGYQCKVNELEYNNILLEVFPLLNETSTIHRLVTRTKAS